MAMRAIAIALIVTVCLTMADNAMDDTPDTIVPEIEPLNMMQAKPAPGKIPKGTPIADKGIVKYGPDMVDPTPGYPSIPKDDDSDWRSEETNSEGYNKLVGPGKTSDMKGVHVQSPGYSVHDVIIKHGYYYLGPSRRRIGDGFGRRRRTQPGVPITNAARMQVAKLQGKKHVKLVKKEEKKKPVVPEMLKPLKTQEADDKKSSVNIVKQAETSDLDKNEVTKAGKAAVDSATGTPLVTPEVGCYKDKGHARDLPVRKKNGSTIAGCGSQCKSFKYFGRQWTGECWCGNSYGKYGKTTGCACSASNIGGWKNCVYATGTGKSVAASATPVAATPAPVPSLAVSVTTGTSQHAQSGQKPSVVVVGTKGTFTGKISCGAKGATKITTFTPPSDLGKIKSVSLTASSRDGWQLTKLSVKSGALAWQPFGCLPRWLDGKPYDRGSSYHGQLHGDKFKLSPGACVA